MATSRIQYSTNWAIDAFSPARWNPEEQLSRFAIERARSRYAAGWIGISSEPRESAPGGRAIKDTRDPTMNSTGSSQLRRVVE